LIHQRVQLILVLQNLITRLKEKMRELSNWWKTEEELGSRDEE